MKIETLCVGTLGTNCYLLEDEASKEAAVIDPGAEGEAILAALEKSGCALRAVLLTHGHYDHTGAVAFLQTKFPDVPVYLNALDIYRDPYLQQLFPPVAGAKNYEEGDTLQIGGLTVEVLLTPGHSEGSVTLRCGDALFCGDTLFAGSCGRTDFPGGNGRTMTRSLKRLAELPGDFRVFPGHMKATTLDAERAGNVYVRQAL